MRNEEKIMAKYDQCLDKIIEQAKKDGIYENICKNNDPKNAVIELQESYPEIMERWGF